MLMTKNTKTDAHKEGILPVQQLYQAVAAGQLIASAPLAEGQLQPASLDLRLGPRAWRLQASFLPGAGQTVQEKIDRFAMHELDLSDGAVLEKGCVYLVELMERLALPENLSAIANPKSSTGRLDVFTRLISDRAQEFESVEAGYEGPLYAEISPRTFSILARQGSRLSQLRLRRGASRLNDDQLAELQQNHGLVSATANPDADLNQNSDFLASINDGIGLSVNLHADGPDGIIGWRARKYAGLIDIDKAASHPISRFWEAVRTDDLTGGGLVLNPDEFYILASREFVCVPSCYAAADVFVFASKSETQGIVLLEAMAQSTPVVAISELGTASILRDGVGSLIAADNIEDFANKVNKILSDKNLSKELGKKAFNYAFEFWSAKKQAEKLIKFYKNINKVRKPKDLKSNLFSIGDSVI